MISMTRVPSKAYNAAADLIERNLVAGRGAKVAYIDDSGKHTYAELAERVGRCANALREACIEPGQRLALGLLDTIDFPVCFLGAIKAGIVPIPLSTRSTATDFAAILADSLPQAAIMSHEVMPVFEEAAKLARWTGKVYVSGGEGNDNALHDRMAAASPDAQTAATGPDDVCFWLYSSGSTGKPKGVIHRQSSLMQTAELYGQGVLGITEHDVVFSAAKLFFAYGLGNALTFPISVGATAILCSGRPTPAVVNAILREQRPTIFFGVPTLFNALLACADLPGKGEHALRFCVSAGEALPEKVGAAWRERTGVDIVDGIGSTELLHIFVSNRPGNVRYGTTGRVVPGYHVRLVDETGKPAPPGEIGELHVNGPTVAIGYWNNAEKTGDTFVDNWVRTGDRFKQTPEGDYVHCGRNDDMLKVGGIYVSPLEVEGALLAHEAVLEAAVVGAADEMGLVKPKAYVVLSPGVVASSALVQSLQQFVKARLTPHKYPRWIEIIPALPKTA
ncbi:MAG TPA: benzoate-CoA ligase family protein, partial [Gemmataceae bacterium]|nr:benzoate-CoA ligase family protein [Gemmataceae bacterium]